MCDDHGQYYVPRCCIPILCWFDVGYAHWRGLGSHTTGCYYGPHASTLWVLDAVFCMWDIVIKVPGLIELKLANRLTRSDYKLWLTDFFNIDVMVGGWDEDKWGHRGCRHQVT